MKKVSDKAVWDLCKVFVAARAGHKCELCHHMGEDCQTHHIYSRSNYSVRYDPMNCLYVCNSCHRWAELVGTRNVIEYLVSTGVHSEAWRQDLTDRKNHIVKADNIFRSEWKDRLLTMLKGAT